MILHAASRFPVQIPAPHGLQPALARPPLGRSQIGVGKPGGMTQNMLYRDVLFAILPKARNIVCHRTIDFDRPLPHQQPDCRCDKRFGAGINTEACVVIRSTERFEQCQFAVSGQGHLD